MHSSRHKTRVVLFYKKNFKCNVFKNKNDFCVFWRNILLNKDDSIKLCDFGVSRGFDDETTTMTYTGTIKYMSPEMRECKPYSFKTDCWSSGCVLFELIKLQKFDDSIIKPIDQSNIESTVEKLDAGERLKSLLKKWFWLEIFT